ncbi:E3 ubiquitin-protein ligase listerin isoform X2 [Pieris brassicae]|nr:E3 ubiquitin-protein ligase listerin isoform X2 [Pieris brassicae]
MGGKSKQSQRTKNNARPSSSGRSAELLNNVINTESTFGALSTGKMVPALFPTMTTIIDNILSNEFVLAFKKLNKKDPITRIKALQELLELINKSDIEEVVAALPNWTVFYLMLTVDNDRKVREFTQACNGAIFSRSGRRAAPHLRRLLPVWLLAVHDDYGPARHTASTHLDSTFPGVKLSEAIAFCKTEIMALVLDNLIGNPEAILNKKIEAPEERQSAASRVRAGSLGALGLLLRLLPPHLPLDPALQPLLSAAPFWKLHAHDDHHVRAAWFEAAGRLIEREGGRLGETVGGRLSAAILAQPERRPDVAAARWAALLLMLRVEDWQKWVQKKDLLVKRLLDTIENGAWGDASLAGDILLPLLARLPEDLRSKELYGDLTRALFAGLELKSILNSKSERQIWIASVAEFLRFLSIQRHDFVTEAVSVAHRTWLQRIFASPDPAARPHLIKYSVGKMASLVKFWMRRATETGDDECEKMIRCFWQNFGATVVAQIDAVSPSDEDVAALLNLHTIAFESLRTGDGKSEKALRFDDEPAPERRDSAPEDGAVAERFARGVTDLLCVGCRAWLECAERRELRAVFPPLVSALRRLGDERLFVEVARAKVGGGPHALYERLWRGWLRGEALRCRALVQLLFLAATHFTDRELELAYDSFDEMSPVVVEWIVSSSLDLRRRAADDWLRGRLVTATLVTLSRRRRPDADRLVLDCLEPRDGEVRVSEEAVAGVVRALSEPPVRRAAAAEVCRTLAGSDRASVAIPLAELLFDCSLDTVGDGRPTEGDEREESGEEGEGWRRLCGPRLAAHARRRLHALLTNTDESLDPDRIERWVSLCRPLLAAGDLDETAKGLLAVDVERSTRTVEAFALRADCVSGRLLCPVGDERAARGLSELVEREETEGWRDPESRDVAPFVRALVFRAGLLREMLRGRSEEAETPTGERFREAFAEVLHDAAAAGSFCEGYVHAPFYESVKRCMERVDAAIDDATSLLPEEDAKELAKSLTRRALDAGFYWAFARKLYLDGTRTKGIEGVPDEPGGDAGFDGAVLDPLLLDEIVTRSGFFHVTQVRGGVRGRYLSAIRGWYLAQGFASDLAASERRELFVLKLTSALASCGLEPLMDDYYKYCDKMFNDRDYWKVPWSVVSCEIGALDLLREVVEAGAWELDAATWDFANIALCSALASLAGTPSDLLPRTKVAAAGRAALGLFASVAGFVENVRAESERRRPSAHVASLPGEWRDIFAPAAHTDVLTLQARLLERAVAPGRGRTTAGEAALTDATAAALPFVRWELAAAARRDSDLSLERLTRIALEALSRDSTAPVHRLAYAALATLAKPLVLEDVAKLKSASERENEEEDAKVSLSLRPYLMALKRRAADLLPDNGRPEEEPPAEWWDGARGFLLTALAALRHADLAGRDLVHHYLECLGDSETIGDVLAVAVRALPAEVERASGPDGGALPPRVADYFTSDPPLGGPGLGADGRSAAGRVACRVVLCAARSAGAAVRAHWSASNPRSADAFRRLVALAVAPPLIEEQLRRLRERAREDLEDVEVTVSRAGGQGEVRARARVEERWAEVTVTLSAAHPLEPPRVEAPPQRSPAASQLHWVRVYLAYQNGWLVTALRLWSEAMRCRVDAAAQCYICYCRLHPTTARLPNVPCHTCNNRFHSACLRKWFKTSKKSNCPLCRTVF